MQTRAAQHIRKDSPIPYYEQLKTVLVEQIRNDRLEPGDLLPSESELCERYGVSRTVVRQALGDLVNQGRLYRMRGKGTFVARAKLREHFLESTVGFFEGESSKAVKRKVLKCELITPPDDAAEALQISNDQKCLQIDRLRYVNDAVAAFSTHHFPEDIHPSLLAELTKFDLEGKSIYTFLEDNCGIRIHSGVRSLEAVSAPKRLAELLEVKSEAPLLYVESVGKEITGRPVEHSRVWHRADRSKFEIEVVGRPGPSVIVS